jgi:Fe-S oxidoreductase
MKMVTALAEALNSQDNGGLVVAVTPEALWACTTCGACQDICPVGVEHVGKIVDMRRYLTLMEGVFSGDEVAKAMDGVEVNGNPLGMAQAIRGEWATGIDNVVIAGEKPADLLFFAGCYASYDGRNKKVAQSLLKVAQTAGFTVAILGKSERCCGEPVRKMGNEYLYQQVAVENIDKIKATGVSSVVTGCPHCYTTLNEDYRELGLDVTVEHATLFMARLMEEGKIKLRNEGFEATFHDSCYLGRNNGVYDEPRTLTQLAGGKITEMKENKRDGFCCGAGGGRILADETAGERINELRVKMAHDTKAPIVISSCPFCLTMFEDGVKTAGLEGQLVPRDITEIMAEHLL